MKILVTGGSGMVGSCIKEKIEKEKEKYNEHEFVFLSSKDCDLRNRYETQCYFQKAHFDYIIHLASNVGGLYKNIEKNIEMFSDNVKINENVLEACCKYNIERGIFVLSSCIYTPSPSKFPMDETMIHEAPPHPSNEGYAYAKRMMEMQCRQYNKKYRTRYTCLIPVNLYGPYDNFKRGEAHVIPELIHRFFIDKKFGGGKVKVYGTGKPLRQFVYAKDFANIILMVLLEDNYNETEPLIICNNEVTIAEMVKVLCEVMDIDSKNMEFDTEKEDGCMRKTVSNEKFKKHFPNYSFTSLKVGLETTYKWFLQNYKDYNTRT